MNQQQLLFMQQQLERQAPGLIQQLLSGQLLQRVQQNQVQEQSDSESEPDDASFGPNSCDPVSGVDLRSLLLSLSLFGSQIDASELCNLIAEYTAPSGEPFDSGVLFTDFMLVCLPDYLPNVS